MPWCPQCDEEFPEGPTCPRCRSPLVELGEVAPGAELQQVGNLPQLKVPRKLRRAFDKMNRPSGAPRPLFAFTMAFVLFAGGFVIGRMGSVIPEGSVLRQRVEPFPGDVSGSVEYVGWASGATREPALVRMDLTSGEIEVVSKFTWPFAGPPTGHERSRVVSAGQSVAVVLSDGERHSYVGAFPATRPLPLWLDGFDAAWHAADDLLVLEREGGLTRWHFTDGLVSASIPGMWTAVHATPGGAGMEGIHANRRHLWRFAEGVHRTISIPDGGRVLAVAPGSERALVEVSGTLQLWDGQQAAPIHGIDGYEASAAVFTADGDRLAVTMHERGGADRPSRVVAIVDRWGKAALKPFPTRPGAQGCLPTPAWEPSDRWVFVAPGDGWLYGVEASGARVHTVNARTVGCGLAWLN